MVAFRSKLVVAPEAEMVFVASGSQVFVTGANAKLVVAQSRYWAPTAPVATSERLPSGKIETAPAGKLKGVAGALVVTTRLTIPPLVVMAPWVPATNEPLSTTGLGLKAPELPAGLKVASG